MKEYKVTYEHQVDTAYSFWTFAIEIIEARGIVHATKKAKDHLTELKKLNQNPMRIAKVYELKAI